MKISFLLLCLLIPLVQAKLQVGFYDSTCPHAEQIIQQVVKKRFSTDRSITGALLRLHFHDCFVTGCDASILIDSTHGKSSEKNASANLTVRGFELIDQAKTKLEAACPGTVSCADIIIIATRDSVALAGGPRYTVPTGRRDGLVSDPDLVDLPGPSQPVSSVSDHFKTKGFNVAEMVTLLGAHTVGVADCGFFSGRLSGPDPTMDPALVSKLSKVCSKPSTGNTPPSAFLDQNTSFIVDNEYYNQIRKKRGILQIDQQLALDSSTAPIVSALAKNANGFRKSFAKAMVKLGTFDVTVGNHGEIRKNCRAFNAPQS